MALGDYTYWLKPESGDSTPSNEIGAGETLTGGTISLVDTGGGVYAWEFTGQASVALSGVTVDPSVAEGTVLAVRMAVPTQPGGSFDGLVGWVDDLTNYRGIRMTRTGGTAARAQWNDTSASSASSPVASTAMLTLVLKFASSTTSGEDRINLWVEGQTGSGDTADVIGNGLNAGSKTLDVLFVGLGASVIRIQDLALWPPSAALSDADCHTLAESGIRATLDGGGDTTAPILTLPSGVQTGATTATVGATTDEANGTQYAFVSTSATPPSATDLKAGTGATWAGSIAISSTGANTHSATGLTASTGYYAHLIHTDAAANDSNIVTSAQFTTTSAANAAPSWSGTPSAMSAKKGQALTTQDITSLVSDADLDTLSYSITGAPTGVTINSSTGVISGTPTAAPGVYACTVEADDGVNSPVSSASFNITVTQCVLALSGAGYNFGDGNDVDTIDVENAVAWEVAVVADELPVTATLYHSASSTTSSTGYMSDIGDDDLVFGTTYVVQARRVSDGEWITFPIAAS